MKQNEKLYVQGMHCRACEVRVEQALERLPGVEHARASIVDNSAQVTYDNERVTREQFASALSEAGYPIATQEELPRETTRRARLTRLLAAVGIGAVLYLLLVNIGGVSFLPTVGKNMTYGLLFVTGLLTSFHCVAMCGGINLTQNIRRAEAKKAPLMPGVLYNLGRVLSYTAVGGIVGAIGSVITPSGIFRGVVAVLAGVFMVLMGLNLLEVFPGLNRFLGRLPRLLHFKGKAGAGPFYVGLLNGLMPCGPLQAMQLYALATGSFVTGALSMLTFGLGTVPLMLLLSVISALLSAKFTRYMLRTGAVLVMALGLVMFTQGLSLSGVAVPGTALAATAPENASKVSTAVSTGTVQKVESTFTSGKYAPITVKQNIPVEWTIHIDAKDINGCNGTFVIPAYNVQMELKPGDNVVRFTPTQSGTVPYSCWMGMIRSAITVQKSDAPAVSAAAGAPSTTPAPQPGGQVQGAALPNCCGGVQQGATLPSCCGRTSQS